MPQNYKLCSSSVGWSSLRSFPAKGKALSVMSVLLILGSSCSSSTDAFVFVSADDVGEDPFVSDTASPVPVEFVELEEDLDEAAAQAEESLERAAGDSTVSEVEVSQVRQAAVVDFAEEAGLNIIHPDTHAGVGLYGGTGENVCDISAMAAFFSQSPGSAQAFADVLSIDVNGIEDYLNELQAGYLLADLKVTNHGFSNNQASPFDATLEAGSAVLVDDQGVPKVRCKCGNPLIPARTPGGRLYLNEQNMTVNLGPNSMGSLNNTTSLQNVIDAETAQAIDQHSQETHVWFSGPQLELVFDFQQEYTLETIHFWNFHQEQWDPDQVHFVFSDADGEVTGQINLSPALGVGEATVSEDFNAEEGIMAQFATVTITGSNDQIDFQNLGFTVTK